MNETKRLYYYTGPNFALEIVARRQLKLSFPNEVNDIFEMTPFDFGNNRDIRKAWRDTIDQFSQGHGFISLSSEWNHPTMWGHYASNHLGVCFGFDVLGGVVPIDYVDSFVNFDRRALENDAELKTLLDFSQKTKSKHWQYENEWRGYVELTCHQKKLKARGANLFFESFNDGLRLREIIIGARSHLTASQFQKALNGYDGVEISTARASFRDFKIVKQRSQKLQK
ncbi:hypothetical protein RUE5091_00981 [Ruegeria denitrificans]|uniref:DUF2971 domain-containing protein n=1 Tax=Ruegeria denitrificans TaxID=1715692 RepID=A0A0P1I531_9RHOB|nr:DUF2971 domain-containing protein [Ruegeria denitrificans]CUJ90092.1 hypothetical protein RUE5091_00981 [Ruegeria denitrificans]